MKAIWKILLVLALLILPMVGRGLYFYRGAYQPSPVTRPNVADIDIPTPKVLEFVDTSPREGSSVIVFDFAHNNNFKETEVSVLLSRLATHGGRPDYILAGNPLHQKLRHAQGYVVISPKIAFTSEEAREVQHFVDSGGRLLLVTDPTRYEVKFDAAGFPSERRGDAGSMNVLSAPLGLVFEDDYLYNMTRNAGSFRDIICSDFADTPLTQGLKEVTFFAAHSISVNGKPVIKGDKNTRSSLKETQGDLVVMAFTRQDRVLGVSDLTFLTEPYNSISDNDQLVSNIAGFLVGGQRSYRLADFPSFFGNQVDLTYAGQEAIGGDVLSQAGALQRAFEAVDKTLIPRKVDSVERDALFIGLYDGTDRVKDLLATRQISITLAPESKAEKTPEASATELPAERTPAPTSTLTPTVPPTPIPLPSVTMLAPTALPAAEPTLELVSVPPPESTMTETLESPIKGKVSVAELGEFPTDSVTLVSLGKDKDRNVMIVLAATKEGLAQTLALLAGGDLSQCLIGEQAAFCSAMPVLPTPSPGFYLPPPEGEVPMTTTTDILRPVEPPLPTPSNPDPVPAP